MNIGLLPTDFALREDETALGRSVISYGIYWKGIAVFILSLLVMVIVHPNLGGFLMLVAIFMLVYEYLAKMCMVVLVTDQRVMIRKGIVFIDIVQLRFAQIESVEILRNPVGMMLDYGTLIVTGTGNRFTFVPFLANAPELRATLDAQLARVQDPA
jgi:hypothetical protein